MENETGNGSCRVWKGVGCLESSRMCGERRKDNLLSLVLQIAMYKFRGKRGLGEVVHVMHRVLAGPANGETGSSEKCLSIVSRTSIFHT